MVAMNRKELLGYEYDWLAVDSVGHVALLSSAGGGYIPETALQDVEAVFEALDRLFGLPATTAAAFAPTVTASTRNDWRLAAERGLYAFDSDYPPGKPYFLVAAPVFPVQLSELPAQFVHVAVRLKDPSVAFAETRVLTDSMLEC